MDPKIESCFPYSLSHDPATKNIDSKNRKSDTECRVEWGRNYYINPSPIRGRVNTQMQSAGQYQYEAVEGNHIIYA